MEHQPLYTVSRGQQQAAHTTETRAGSTPGPRKQSWSHHLQCGLHVVFDDLAAALLIHTGQVQQPGGNHHGTARQALGLPYTTGGGGGGGEIEEVGALCYCGIV